MILIIIIIIVVVVVVVVLPINIMLFILTAELYKTTHTQQIRPPENNIIWYVILFSCECSWFELESYEMNIVNAFRVGGTMLYWYLLYLNTLLHCTTTAGRCGSDRRHWCRTRGNAALRGRLSWGRGRVGNGRTLGDRRVGRGRFMYLDDVGSGCWRGCARSGLGLLGLVRHRDTFRRSWWRGAWRTWMPPTVPVTLVVDSREYEHVEHQKKTADSNCDPQGCRVAVVVPRGQSLKKSCFVFVVVFVRATHQIFFWCWIRETFSS